MSFIRELKNFSDFDLVVTDLPSTARFYTYTATYTFLNVSYSTISYQIYSAGADMQGNLLELISQPKSVFIIKTKKNFYIHFRIDGGYLYIYLCDKLDFDTSVKVNISRGGLSPFPGGTNPKIALCIKEDMIVLNSSAWASNTYAYSGLGINKNEMEELFGEFESTIYSPEYGNASGEDGYLGGSFDNSSDLIPIPTKPNIGVTNVGFVNVYAPNENALVNLGSELFPDFTPVPSIESSDNVAEMIARGFTNLGENVVNFTNMFINSNLINYVIDCHIIPVAPTISDSENIKIGFKQFNQSAVKVTSDYIDFDCGTLNIKEYYTNFIDYVGTRAKLYLPFVGFVPIENEYFQNGLLQVIYRFNVIDGSFMAYVLSSSSKSELANSVIASYGGNACVHIPITGLNYSSMMSGIMTGTVATIGASTVSPVAGVIAGLSSAMNTLASKPSMQSSNGYNATSAYLGVRFPYLIIEREVSNFSELYPHENGFPSNITKTISEMSGYFEMNDIHIETLTATEEEKEMILELLQNGVVM